MKIRLNIFNAFYNVPDQNTCFFLDDIGEIVEYPPPDPLLEAPLWRNPPDDNLIGDIFHLEVIEVDFIKVNNILASSQAAPIFENPHGDKRLIMEPIQDKHLAYRHRELQDLSVERSRFGMLRRVLFLVECYMIIKKKG